MTRAGCVIGLLQAETSGSLGARACLTRWPLLPLASAYGLAVRTRSALYRRGWLPKRALPCRVVSVGNLTVGGTGKTPVVISLAEWLLTRGKRVGVLSRGYRRQSRDTLLLVSDGRSVLAGPGEAGDEPHLIARRCPGAVVAVGADRYRLGRWVLERFPIDCFLLDDGFQHLGLHRDVDLLLVDAADPVALEALLPAGRLREPLSAAGRATAVLLTRADSPNSVAEVLSALAEVRGRADPPILVRFVAEALIDVVTGAVEKAESLCGRSAVVFSGIANASSFRTLLARQGARVVHELVFPDHHVYTDQDLGAVREHAKRCGADVVVTTEKDAVKVAPLAHSDDRLWAVRLGTEVTEGRERLEQLVLGSDE